MLLEKVQETYQKGEPIFIEDILSLYPEFTRAYVFRLAKQDETNGDLVRFSRGVYCIPKETVLGEVTTTSTMVANTKYVSSKDNIYGIYSGLSLLNDFAVSNQVPNITEIVTNNETTRKRVVDIEGMKFVLRKSRFEITKDNYQYYTLLQLFLELGNNPDLSMFSKERILEYIKLNNIDKSKLIQYAMSFPAQVMKNLIGSNIINVSL